jgi:hypothetical protein
MMCLSSGYRNRRLSRGGRGNGGCKFGWRWSIFRLFFILLRDDKIDENLSTIVRGEDGAIEIAIINREAGPRLWSKSKRNLSLPLQLLRALMTISRMAKGETRGNSPNIGVRSREKEM